MLLADVGSRLVFPPSLQTVALWGEEGTGNLGALHAILAASKVGKLSAEFVGLVQGISDYDSAAYSLRHVELVACKLKKQELQRFLRHCYDLQTFCYTADAFASDHIMGEGPLDRFPHTQIAAKDLVEALEVNGCTLRDLHIDSRATSAPIKGLQSFTGLERLRVARSDIFFCSRDLAGRNGDNDDRDEDGEMNWDDNSDEDDKSYEDDEHHIYHECDTFLDKLPPSLQLLRIDRADRAILKELTTIPTAIRKSLPKLEKLELQSHNQRLLQAAASAVQYSGVVVELVGCRNDCWNCDAASMPWICRYGCC